MLFSEIYMDYVSLCDMFVRFIGHVLIPLNPSFLSQAEIAPD